MVVVREDGVPVQTSMEKNLSVEVTKREMYFVRSKPPDFSLQVDSSRSRPRQL